MSKKELTDFQKSFILGRGLEQQLFTQKEFDDAMNEAEQEMVAMAIATTKAALKAEREACAEIIENHNDRKQAAALIRARGENKTKPTSNIILS